MVCVVTRRAFYSGGMEIGCSCCDNGLDTLKGKNISEKLFIGV